MVSNSQKRNKSMLQKHNLTACPLFMRLNAEVIDELIENTIVEKKIYSKGDLIVKQGSSIDYLYLLVDGKVSTEMITSEGNIINIDILEAVVPLAIAFTYAAMPRFPVAVVAMQPTEIYLLSKEMFLRQMMNNEVLFRNFLRITTSFTVFLSAKVAMLSTKSLKSKVALYILNNTTQQQPHFTPKHNQTQLAEYLGVQRPSLARTLGELISDGAIVTQNRKITVLDRRYLEKLVF